MWPIFIGVHFLPSLRRFFCKVDEVLQLGFWGFWGWLIDFLFVCVCLLENLCGRCCCNVRVCTGKRKYCPINIKRVLYVLDGARMNKWELKGCGVERRRRAYSVTMVIRTSKYGGSLIFKTLPPNQLYSWSFLDAICLQSTTAAYIQPPLFQQSSLNQK